MKVDERMTIRVPIGWRGAIDRIVEEEELGSVSEFIRRALWNEITAYCMEHTMNIKKE